MTQNIYPLSATNESYIPLDVIESRGYVKSAFNAATPLAAMLTGFNKEESLLHIYATQNVIVDFSADGLSANSGQSFIAQAATHYILKIWDDYIDLTGDGTGGNAYLNYITKYDTYASSQQLGGES